MRQAEADPARVDPDLVKAAKQFVTDPPWHWWIINWGGKNLNRILLPAELAVEIRKYYERRGEIEKLLQRGGNYRQ